MQILFGLFLIACIVCLVEGFSTERPPRSPLHPSPIIKGSHSNIDSQPALIRKGKVGFVRFPTIRVWASNGNNMAGASTRNAQQSSRGRPETEHGSNKPSPAKKVDELDPTMEVRLLVPSNESAKVDFMHGVVSVSEARSMATKLGLDLMMLNDKQTPHLYKICDSAKFRYDQEKKKREAFKSKVEMKEVLLSYDIGEHDLEVRARAALRFLNDGDRVSNM